VRKIIIALSLATSFGGGALAAEKCDVAMADWKPREALKAKLESDGWQVRSIKSEDGCYDAHAITAEGKEVEAYFNPQTFQSIAIKVED